jgi:hypothetical protein
MMPLRDRTRTQKRAARITAERRHNHEARLTPPAEYWSAAGPAPPESDDDPPPF